MVDMKFGFVTCRPAGRCSTAPSPTGKEKVDGAGNEAGLSNNEQNLEVCDATEVSQ